MKICDLKPAAYNPRKMTQEQLKNLKKAIEEFGDLSGIFPTGVLVIWLAGSNA